MFQMVKTDILKSSSDLMLSSTMDSLRNQPNQNFDHNLLHKGQENHKLKNKDTFQHETALSVSKETVTYTNRLLDYKEHFIKDKITVKSLTLDHFEVSPNKEIDSREKPTYLIMNDTKDASHTLGKNELEKLKDDHQKDLTMIFVESNQVILITALYQIMF